MNRLLNRWTILKVSLFILLYLLHTGYTHFNQDVEGFYWGGLWPEVTGFFFEVVIIILVLDRWKVNEERKLKITAEKRLREHLLFFLNKIHNELNLIDSNLTSKTFPNKFHGDCRKDNELVLNAMNNKIESLSEDSDEFKKLTSSIRMYCKRHLHFIECMVPIASQLEKNHFKAWVRISFYMGELINDDAERVESAQQRYSDKRKILNIIKNINRFDEESHSKKLFNGAAD